MTEGIEIKTMTPIAFNATFDDVQPGGELDHICLVLWDAQYSVEVMLPGEFAKRVGDAMRGRTPEITILGRRLKAPPCIARYTATKFTYTTGTANVLKLADRKGGIGFVLTDDMRDDIAETLRVKGSMILNGQKIPHGVW